MDIMLLSPSYKQISCENLSVKVLVKRKVFINLQENICGATLKLTFVTVTLSPIFKSQMD